jgi:DNA-binding SARP family transcriptional activator
VDGCPVTGFESTKVRGLLAYLVLEADRSHTRSQLAGLFWSDLTEKAALGNLRHAITNLRRVIGDQFSVPPFILCQHDEVRFNTASDYECDAIRFKTLVQLKAHGPPAVDQLEQAVRLYRADLLDGLSLADCAAFEEWVLLKREQFSRMFISTLSLLYDHYEHQRDFEQAEWCARLQVEREPWDEAAHQRLMRVLVLTGHRGAALRQYERCCQLLLDELGVEPGHSTTRLYQSIRDGTFPGAELVQPRSHELFKPETTKRLIPTPTGQVPQNPIFNTLGHVAPLADESLPAAPNPYFTTLDGMVSDGEKAIQESAYDEAARQFAHGIRLLSKESDIHGFTKQKIQLWFGLGTALGLKQSYAGPEVFHAYTRVEELGRACNSATERYLARVGLIAHYQMRAEYQMALPMADEALYDSIHLANDSHQTLYSAYIHTCYGQLLVLTGEFGNALRYLEQAIGFYRHDSDTLLKSSRYVCFPVIAQARSAWALWFLGKLDVALTRANEATAMAREIGHAYDLACALNSRVYLLHLMYCESAAIEQSAFELLDLSLRYGLQYHEASANIILGWLKAKAGCFDEGIVMVQHGLTAMQSLSVKSQLSHYLYITADMYRRNGQAEPALATLATALEHIKITGERYLEAELHTLRGHVFEDDDHEDEAECCYRMAMNIAHRRYCKSSELRAIISLTQLLKKQGKPHDVQSVLASIYAEFSEGLDTPDLRQASELIHERK